MGNSERTLGSPRHSRRGGRLREALEGAGGAAAKQLSSGWAGHEQVLRLAERYGKVNEHNGRVPRDWWLEDWEKQAIIDFHDGIRWKATGG